MGKQDTIDISPWDLSDLLGRRNFGPPSEQGLGEDDIEWENVYQSMKRIGGQYGLTPREFKEHCTIPSPSSDPTFYPFHVLPKPEAIGNWGWKTLYSMARAMLNRMKNGCNRHAEQAGFGEEMNPLRFIYWWTHHLCRQIQTVKKSRPATSTEEIGFHILDRWGLPVAPRTETTG